MREPQIPVRHGSIASCQRAQALFTREQVRSKETLLGKESLVSQKNPVRTKVHGTTLFGDVLLGLSGGSCAGKTTLASALLQRQPSAVLLSFDDYYRDLSHLSVSDRAKKNYDHPDALDVELFLEHMDALASGHSVDVPLYDMATHTRPGGTFRLESAPLVIVDGILLLSVEECREKLDLKVFVDAPSEVRLKRRLVRDTNERGRDEQSVRTQFRRSVEPMHEKYVVPSSKYADLRFEYPFEADEAAGEVLERTQRFM